MHARIPLNEKLFHFKKISLYIKKMWFFFLWKAKATFVLNLHNQPNNIVTLKGQKYTVRERQKTIA